MTGVTLRILTFQLRDLARNRWLLAYTLFFFLMTEGLLRFSGVDSRALLGLTNIVLLIVPFVTVTFGTMYVYSSREFVEMILAQPVARLQLYAAVLLGLMLPLAASLLIGVGIPLIIHASDDPSFAARSISLLLSGIALTFTMTAIAVWIANRVSDRIKGLAMAMSLWLVFAVLYDGVMLLVAVNFGDYPLERVMLGMTLLNPIDTARVMLLLQFDIAALMSYTGAVFKQFFSETRGLALLFAATAFWTIAPGWLGLRAFRNRDF